MSKKPEISWSLMHPTPLNVDYMKQVVQKAANYRVDSFEICADCHTNLGGMDGLADYAPYPCTFKSIDQKGIAANIVKLREILSLAHSIGKPVYYWHREAMVPDGLLEDLPHLLDENGEFDLLGSAYEELLRYKISASFEAVPELDGLVLTLTEATYSVIHSTNPVKYPPRKVVEHVVRIFADELERRNKRFILRSFGSIAQDYEDIIAGAAEAAKDHAFEIETKITPYDFDPFLPVNPFLRKVPGLTLGAECDCLGEFLGAGILPSENIENIVNYVRSGTAADVDRYTIRLDRIGNRVFDCYEINLYAYGRAIDDDQVTAGEIRREYLAKTVPEKWWKLFTELGLQGLEMVKKINFVDGNVIFHQFPTAKTLKLLKAGFIFALFKEGVPLANGKDVWSILWQNNTPGRAAIMEEKREALRMAERGVELLNSLAPEAGFEDELNWRKERWQNATVAAGAFYELCNIVCAYFDDMEALDIKGSTLHPAVDRGKAELSRMAGFDLKDEVISKESFINGLGQHIFRPHYTVMDTYLKPFYAIFDLLEKEFDMEFAMREKYRKNAFDYIICGSITDEWRIKRCMHAAHVTVNNGELFRFAGNVVFPNGSLEMVLDIPQNGGIMEFYGDITETSSFTLAVDGKKVAMNFDGDGFASIPVTGNDGKVKIVLTKASGAFFPRFRAVKVVEKQ
ncbi:MAG: hypothetical protein J6W00_01315 [Lentisphaeria bacterium]|nr:hypothetical protein [Lentisphaeria bacterium]